MPLIVHEAAVGTVVMTKNTGGFLVLSHCPAGVLTAQQQQMVMGIVSCTRLRSLGYEW